MTARMDRPSHWILASILIAAPILWLAGTPGSNKGRSTDEVALPNPEGPTVVSLVRGNDSVSTQGRPIETVDVVGRVVDRFGYAVSGALVRLVLHSDLGEDGLAIAGRGLPADLQATTGDDGRFGFEVARPLDGQVLVQAPGRYAPARSIASLEPMEIVLQDALPWSSMDSMWASSRRGDRVERPSIGEGLVRSVTGGPSDARIAVAESGAMTTSDAQGRFLVPVSQDDATLVAWTPDGEASRVEFQGPRKQGGRHPLPAMVLSQASEVRGRLVDEDGNPLSGLRVVVADAGISRWARSNAEGRFVVRGLLDEVAELEVVPHEGLLGQRVSFEVEDETELGDLRLERADHIAFSFEVVDEDLKPMPLVHVVADQENGLRRAYGRADQSGVVRLPGLGKGAVVFEVRDAQQVDQSLQIAGFEDGFLIVSR
ncbi:MAG: carboxypeptidase-like regulatory domain-containing protein [Planctomycetota bacterium]